MSNYNPYTNWGGDPYHHPPHYSGPPQGPNPPQGPPPAAPHVTPGHHVGPPGVPHGVPHPPPHQIPPGHSQGPHPPSTYVHPQCPPGYNTQPYNAMYPSYPSYTGNGYQHPSSYNYGSGSGPFYPNPVSTNTTVASSFHDNFSSNSSVSSKSNKDKEKPNDTKTTRSKYSEQRVQIKGSLRYLLNAIERYYEEVVGDQFLKTHINDLIKFCMSKDNDYKDPKFRETISTFLGECIPKISPQDEFYDIIVEGIFVNVKFYSTEYNYVLRQFNPKDMILDLVKDDSDNDFEKALIKKNKKI